MEFKDKKVVITGGAKGIGRNIAQEFKKNGADVAVIDKDNGPAECDIFYRGDISEEENLIAFSKKVLEKIVSLAGRVRVNAVSPGWIDTSENLHPWSNADEQQHPVKRIGKVQDIAAMVLFLCSEKSSFMTGENVIIDGGMSRMMTYHHDEGWEYKSR